MLSWDEKSSRQMVGLLVLPTFISFLFFVMASLSSIGRKTHLISSTAGGKKKKNYTTNENNSSCAEQAVNTMLAVFSKIPRWLMIMWPSIWISGKLIKCNGTNGCKVQCQSIWDNWVVTVTWQSVLSWFSSMCSAAGNIPIQWCHQAQVS